MAGGEDERALDQTATWSVAVVCAAIVIISVLLEHVLHSIGHFLHKKHKEGLIEALEKIKNELMVLGFISLLMTFGQNYIASICVPKKFTKDFLPCKHKKTKEEDHLYIDHGRLLWYDRRFLADDPPKECKEGYEELITVAGLHQLHIFIFFLAVFHVIYSTLTMIFGRAKTREWKTWEKEIMAEHLAVNDPSTFRLTKETSFVKSHTGVATRNPILFYIVCFFRQFFMSVRKADYLAMRHAFVSVHLSSNTHFNFQKYIKKSLEDDFKIIVGISPLLWSTAVLYLFANVDGAHAMIWLSIFPVVIILAVGTKLQAIITQMAVEIQERHAVVQGIPLVELSDKHFWFSQPTFILYLIQLTLFMNSFEMTHFFWVMYEFGLNTCFHENPILQYGRVIIGLLVQGLCAYSILPLYALVTQMGSKMKRSIFDDQTSKVLKSWHHSALKKKEPKGGHVVTKTLGHPTNPSSDAQLKSRSSDTKSSKQSANIIASVDIPDDKPNYHTK